KPAPWRHYPCLAFNAHLCQFSSGPHNSQYFPKLTHAVELQETVADSNGPFRRLDRRQITMWASAAVDALSRTRRTGGADRNDLRRGSSLVKEFEMARICVSAKARLRSAAASFFVCR